MAVTEGFLPLSVRGLLVNTSRHARTTNFKAGIVWRNVDYIVMHYTGNPQDTAAANANYFASADASASAHYFVDDHNIYQSVPLYSPAWHCGAASYRHKSCRNENSIGIEMCCTAGNYRVSEETKRNAAYLCAALFELLGWSAEDVDNRLLRHYDVTGKNCPAQMIGQDNPEWIAFRALVKRILQGEEIDMSKDEMTALFRAEAQKIKDMIPECVQAYLNELGGKKPDQDWQKEQLPRVIGMGITDGTRPLGLCTRIEAATMIANAVAGLT